MKDLNTCTFRAAKAWWVDCDKCGTVGQWLSNTPPGFCPICRASDKQGG